MSPNKYQKVYAANGTLHATAVQTTLECAGIPVEVIPSKNETVLDVLVPEAWAGEAHQLLYPERRAGEIFMSLPAEMN